MKAIPLYIFFLLNFSCAIAQQPTCDCKKEFDNTVNAEMQFVQMSEVLKASGKSTSDAASLGLVLDRIKQKRINTQLVPDPSYNTLVKEILPICKELNPKLDSLALTRLLGGRTTTNSQNFEQYKSVLACHALCQLLDVSNTTTSANSTVTDIIGATSTINKQEQKVTPPTLYWPLIFGILMACLIGGIAYLYSRLQKSERALVSQENYIKGLEADFARKLDQFRPESRPKSPPFPPPHSGASPIVAANPVEEERITPPPAAMRRIYLRPPNGNVFPEGYDHHRPYETYYMIEYRPGERNGNLKLVDDAATRSQAFSMVDILRSACDLLGDNQPHSPESVRQTPGTVEMTDAGYWIIQKKVQLDW